MKLKKQQVNSQQLNESQHGCLPANLCKEIRNDLDFYRETEYKRRKMLENLWKDDFFYSIILSEFSEKNTHLSNCKQDVIMQSPQHSPSITKKRHNAQIQSIDLESKLNRIYSYLLVKYFWIFLTVGLVISIAFTALSFMKQPLPNILDVRRGFGARGEGTLTSQLIIMKNVKKLIDSREKELLTLYEHVKKQNVSNTQILDEQSDDFTSDSNEEFTDPIEDEQQEIHEPDQNNNIHKRDTPEESIQINSRYKYEDLMNGKIIENYYGKNLIELLPNMTLKSDSIVENCDYSFALDKNFEIYFKAREQESVENNETTRKIENSNLLSLDNLKSLCEWDRQIVELTLGKFHLKNQCYFSLPFVITSLSSKSDCSRLTHNDVQLFENTLRECYPLYKTGILYTAALESRSKSTLDKLLNSNNLQSYFVTLPEIRNNVCFKKNLMYLSYEFLMDSSLFQTNLSEISIKYSSLWIMNEQTLKYNQNKTRLYNSEDAFSFYMKYFHNKQSPLHNSSLKTQLAGINLIGIREEAAMRFITQDMLLVVIAISLICVVTLIYMRSISIAIVVNLGVGLSVGIAFFAYRLVYNLELFPFLNMMAAFILIGIACDNVFVLFDCWFQEKCNIIWNDYHSDLKDAKLNHSKSANGNGNVSLTPEDEVLKRYMQFIDKNSGHIEMFVDKNDLYIARKVNYATQASCESENGASEKLTEENAPIEYELNPMYVRSAHLSDKQLIRIMGGTLRHAASSIFVTSFTTAAAFLTNLITQLPYVQLFGLFTGTCILVYFLLIITMVCSFLILYEKYSHTYDLVDYMLKNIKSLKKLHIQFDKIMGIFTRLNHKIIGFYLPKFLIQAKIYLVVIFFIIGVCGMVTVFYKPKLKPPPSWRYQFFKSNNLFELFEHNLRDRFLSYKMEEKRNLTNPEIFFLFGIHDRDTGFVFNPDDDGYLVYDRKFNFNQNETQLWLHHFVTQELASRRDLFIVDELVHEWDSYFKQIQWYCSSHFKLDQSQLDKIQFPFDGQAFKKCQMELASMLANQSISTFEGMIASGPRRIVFIDDNFEAKMLLLRVRANRTFHDYNTVSEYYNELKEFHKEALVDAPDGYKTGWFISIGFALYDLQYQLIHGTYSSLIASMCIALIILLLTSGNLVISFFAIVTISFSIATTIAIFVFLGWHLNILESVVIIMSVGLCVDFSCHYGVAYIKSEYHRPERKKYKNFCEHYKNGKKERASRIYDTFKRVGSAVLMAAFTTFLAGLSMYPSRLISFTTMGQFLMLVMFISYIYSTFFFVPLCALLGPTNNFGDIKLNVVFNSLTKLIVSCFKRDKKNNCAVDDNELNENLKLKTMSITNN